MTATAEWPIVLSMLPTTKRQRRIALGVGLACFVGLVAAAPFARVPLVPIPGFIPCYESILVINDLITAVLLFGQFRIARSRALLVLGCGYLFTALMAACHALTFPGLFSETGLLGAGPQSTAWLYMFWHAGFPLAVLGYVLLGGTRRDDVRGRGQGEMQLGIAVVASLVFGFVMLATAGEALLPAVMAARGYTDATLYVSSSTWAFSLAAILVLLRRRTRTMLDMWLMVTMFAWMCDIALSAVLNAGRFDLGFYAGRFLGLLASSFILVVLLLETRALYIRLALSLEAESRERGRRLAEMQAVLTHVSRLAEIGQMVSVLVHEVNQPLTATANYVQAGRSMVKKGLASDLPPLLDKASAQANRAVQLVQRLRDFARKGEIRQSDEDLCTLVEETVQFTLGAAARRAITFDISIPPEAAWATIDKIQIQQVLLNLLRNAVEALAETKGPLIEIATRPVGGDRIEIRVVDNGPGLPPAVREKLFQPFVTTKAAGMGVGLSICQGIVEAHGGTICAEDRPGGGTVFRFTVPRAQATLEDHAEMAA